MKLALKHWRRWLLWWEIDPAELGRPAVMRRFAALLAAIAAAEAVFYARHAYSPFNPKLNEFAGLSLAAALAWIVLGCLLLRGNRAAILGLMALRTIVTLFGGVMAFDHLAHRGDLAIYLPVSILGWTVYMHVFYAAFHAGRPQRPAAWRFSGERQRHGGFSLLELSVVLVIIGLLAAMGTATQGMVESARRGQTTSKLNIIEGALMEYRRAYNRLPCPADASLAETDANYGVEAANMGSCTGGTPAATFSDATHRVVEGAVPFKQLGLPKEFMYDGWGRKFAYAVDQRVTATRAMLGQSLSEQCGISVTDAGGVAGNRTSGAVYALVSFGSDGHGGYLKGGARMNAGSTNTDEQINCHCDINAAATAYAASYVAKDATANPASSTDTFDDFVRFKERWQMMTTDDMYQSGAPVCNLGFRADGTNVSDYSGTSVATGDINGDGIADLIIGAPAANGRNGYVYVVFGTKSGFPDPLPLSSLDGSNGFRLDGVTVNNEIGYSVAAGDINGDGIADLIIGAPWANASAGYTYVVFGKSGAWPATQVLNTGGGNLIDGTQGFRLDGVNGGDTIGNSVAAGDINGDGKADLIIGAYFAPAWAAYGYTYVVFGKSGAWPATQTLATGGGNLIDGTQGFRLDGVTTGDYAGIAVAAGDINGDGKADLITGAYGANGSAGYTYVVFGKSGAWPATQTLATGGGNLIDGTQGFRLDGVSGGDSTGSSVAAGDINGDGKADLVIGAYNANSAGYVYVVFGKSGAWPATQVLNTGGGNLIDGTQGFRLDGVTAGDSTGYSVAAGDINGDGKADLVIGARFAPGWSQQGYTYVVFGKSGAWPATQVLNTGGGNLIDGTQGFRLDGVGGQAGYSVAAGDITGDGKADVITGALNANSRKGYTYIYFGKASGWTSPFSLGGL